jgi:hypothetical protein
MKVEIELMYFQQIKYLLVCLLLFYFNYRTFMYKSSLKVIRIHSEKYFNPVWSFVDNSCINA